MQRKNSVSDTEDVLREEFETRLFQILNTNKTLPRSKDQVIVRVKLDNSIQILWKDKLLSVKEIPTIFKQ
ncbi:MAG: hypothetical protein FWB86_09440 [Treponema sp.]|nr:hypothetical protein [Treponema sp.]MCL2252207.1 hypothetical protein [Treponema sp.]